MAIFSQESDQTSTDFRKYNYVDPNRTIPFQLPNNIEKKLSKLLSRINMKTASIDIIYSKNDTFYFLEINPVGQFGMVSYPCNYNLEKIIAECL